MILVLTGTQNFQFDRLINQIINLKNENKINEPVVVQAGSTKIKNISNFKSSDLYIFDFKSSDEINNYIDNARMIITHGGTSSIISGLKKRKIVLVVPRLKKFNEHVDDHQLEIVQYFSAKKLIIALDDINDLEEKINSADFAKLEKYIDRKNEIYSEIISDLERL